MDKQTHFVVISGQPLKSFFEEYFYPDQYKSIKYTQYLATNKAKEVKGQVIKYTQQTIGDFRKRTK